MTETNRRKLTIMTVVAVLAVYFGSIWFRPLYAPGEICCAQIGREMLLSGNFLSPTLNGLPWETGYSWSYGLIALSMKIFGETPFAVRFPAAFFTLLTGLFLLGTAKRFFDIKTAWMAALLYLCSFGVYLQSVWVSLLVPACFCMVSALLSSFFYAAEKEKAKVCFWFLTTVFFLVIGIFWTRGSIGLAGLIPLFYLLFKKQYIRAVLLGTAWAAAVLAAGSSGIFSAAVLPSVRTVFLYPGLFIAGSLPALFPALGVLSVLRKKGGTFFTQNETLFGFTFVLVLLLVCGIFSPLPAGSSLLLLYPFGALLCARCFTETVEAGEMFKVSRIFQALSLVIGGTVLLFVIAHYLPFIPGKYKFFTGSGLVPFAVTTGLVLLWYNMAAKEKDCFPERKFLYFCVGTGVIMLSLPHLIPFKISRHYDQTALIQRALRPRLHPNAQLFADGSMAPAAAWALKRPVTVFAPAGILAPGLEKSARKAVTWQQLGKLITRAPKGQQFIIFTRSNVPRGLIPVRRTVIRSGKTAIIIYGDTEL